MLDIVHYVKLEKWLKKNVLSMLNIRKKLIYQIYEYLFMYITIFIV